MQMDLHYLVVDGSKSTNGDVFGGGYIANFLKDTKSFTSIFEFHKQLVVPKIYRNYFELLTIIYGLSSALSMDINNIIICSDCQLSHKIFHLIKNKKDNQLKKYFNTDLIPIIKKFILLVGRFSKVQFKMYKSLKAHHLSRLYIKKQIPDLVKREDAYRNTLWKNKNYFYADLNFT